MGVSGKVDTVDKANRRDKFPNAQRGQGSVESTSLIVALSDDGELFPVEKFKAHEEATHHLAISIFLFKEGRMLLQQRAADKYHSGGLWANACCSHPSWGEDISDCAARRLKEELGAITHLEAHGFLDYRADVGNGMVEFERAHIFSGQISNPESELALNPAEVQSFRLISASELRSELETAPGQFTAWFQEYMQRDDEPLRRAMAVGSFNF